MKQSETYETLRNFFDHLAPKRDHWINKNKYYYDQLILLHQWLVEKDKSVLEIGCGTGKLLAEIAPREGEGIDFSYEMVKIATRKYPSYKFRVMDAHHLEYDRAFDYILLSNLLGYVDDVWQILRELKKVCHPRSRIVITNYSYLWQPVVALAERLKLKMPDRLQNWLPQEFIEHFLYLNGFETVKKGKYLHIPFNVPIVSDLINALCANLPVVNQLGLIEFIVARPIPREKPATEVSVTVIVPTHKEAGNIETIIERMSSIGTQTELVFVDLPADDGTADKIKEQIRSYRGKLTIKYVQQSQKTGKIGAIRLGVRHSQGEIVLIYDADMTTPPEDLHKFYLALIEGKADLINGTRLIYPTEKGAMRFINHIGNWIFAQLFSWSLGQQFSDTLCGSKGFWRKDFDYFEKYRTKFDDMDKYGDFYLLLGAYRRNLKIAEVPVRYKTRRYGDTKLDRFRNGWAFLKMFIYFYWFYKLKRVKDF